MAWDRRSLVRWGIAAAALAAVFATALGWMLLRGVVLCNMGLRLVAEPPGWIARPVLDKLGGFTVEGRPGTCVGHGMQCSTEDARLTMAGVCPRTGVSLDGWFSQGGIYAGPADLRVRSVGAVFVVSGQRAPGQGEELLGSFERVDLVTRPAFADGDAIVPVVLMSMGLVGLFVAGALARRQLTDAEAYASPMRWKPGTRLTSGPIVFADGSAPVASTDGGLAFAGPVLVQVASLTPGSYREAPATHAAVVLDGDLLTLARDARMRAASHLSRMFVLGVAFLAVVVLWELAPIVRGFRLD